MQENKSGRFFLNTVYNKVTVMTPVDLYWVAHKKRPQFSALEKTHVVSLGKIALAIG